MNKNIEKQFKEAEERIKLFIEEITEFYKMIDIFNTYGILICKI